MLLTTKSACTPIAHYKHALQHATKTDTKTRNTTGTPGFTMVEVDSSLPELLRQAMLHAIVLHGIAKNFAVPNIVAIIIAGIAMLRTDKSDRKHLVVSLRLTVQRSWTHDSLEANARTHEHQSARKEH